MKKCHQDLGKLLANGRVCFGSEIFRTGLGIGFPKSLLFKNLFSNYSISIKLRFNVFMITTTLLQNTKRFFFLNRKQFYRFNESLFLLHPNALISSYSLQVYSIPCIAIHQRTFPGTEFEDKCSLRTWSIFSSPQCAFKAEIKVNSYEMHYNMF